MGLSKLERYYQAEFGPRDDPDAEAPRRVPPPDPERSIPRRRGPGLFKILFLASSLASFGTFLLSALMPCNAGGRPGFLPQGLVAAACARQDMFGQIVILKDRLHAVTSSLR